MNAKSAQLAQPNTSRAVLLALLAWLGLALVLFAGGLLDQPPKPLIPALIWGTTLAVTAVFAKSRRLRAWVTSIDLRWLVSFHLVRIYFGVAFLYHLSIGELPEVFALRGGYGDIAAGLLAAVAIAIASTRNKKLARASMWIFNIFALADILMVFGTAQYVIFTDGFSVMALLTTFPYALLPLFVVPLVLLTHFAIFANLLANRPRRDPAEIGLG